VFSVCEREQSRAPAVATLEADKRELLRRVVSLICSTTGRQRTPAEHARMELLVREIDRVRREMRTAFARV
jgi:hypothetical protein